jgi:flagellin-like hook-associated protein FlgL
MKPKSQTIALAVLAAATLPSSGALSVLDSSAFANRYNGDEIFDGTTTTNSWVATGGMSSADLSLNGTNVIQTLGAANNNGWLQHDSGATPWEQGVGSWTVDVRANISANAGAGGFVIWGSLNGSRDIMTIRENSVTSLGGTVYDSNDNVGGFHNFRLAYDSADNVYHYFRDGVQITPVAGVGQQSGTGNTRLIVGDCCTNIGGSGFGGNGTVVEYEYIRYDNTGAFSPIPEPSTAALFSLAGLLFLRRRR